MALFVVKNLDFSYSIDTSIKALSDINLCIEEGSFNVICGKSGSGKTTLMKLMKPALTPAGDISGDILFCKKNIKEYDDLELASKIGFVMQDVQAQIVTDVVWHELCFGLENLGIDENIIKRKVAEVSAYFGIENLFDKEMNELSGGQKQILNLASVMTMDPLVLILDEPTSQLDPIAASDFLDMLKKINSELSTTIILSEHRLEEVLPLADNVIIMDGGRIISNDKPLNAINDLFETDNEIFQAMPSASRIYYGLNLRNSKHISDKCPVTVREGKAWLENEAGEKIHFKASDNYDNRSFEEKEDKALIIKNLFFRYSRMENDVIKDLSLEVEKGCIYSVIGGNGSGKTTLLNIICNLLKPYSGKIEAFSIRTDKINRKGFKDIKISMLPQDVNALFVKACVLEELLEMFDANDEEELEKEQKEKLKEAIDFLGLKKHLNRHPYDLSGGEQQRLALGKVLLTEPKILLLDEPTKCVDVIFKNKLGRILQKLCDDGVTIIMVSHDLEFCAKYANRVGMLFDGKVISEGSPHEIFGTNYFYTTSASRISRNVLKNKITVDDVINSFEQIK